ncbi:MAG: hypothetical protein QXU62_02715 [Thermofilaceae archaeon]
MGVRGKAVLAVVLLLLLAELPLASAYQVRGWCTYSTFFCPSGGGGDISGIGLGGLGALSVALPQLLEELGVLPRPQSADSPKTGYIVEQQSQAGGPRTGAVRDDSQQQVEAAKDSIVKQREDNTLKDFKDRAREKGWSVKRQDVTREVSKRELLRSDR